MSKIIASKMIEVSLHPQQNFSGLYYNVYSSGNLIGTITDNKLTNAFKRYKTKIIDVGSGYGDSYKYGIDWVFSEYCGILSSWR